MKHEIYGDLKIADDLSFIEFISVGKNIPVKKRIEFDQTKESNIVNLAFGDVQKDGRIDDYAISDNGDRNKILATIAHGVNLYVNRYPEKWVYFRGSTPQRMRLYRMAITINLEELLLRFHIFAEQEHIFVPFQKNIFVAGILVKKKVL